MTTGPTEPDPAASQSSATPPGYPPPPPGFATPSPAYGAPAGPNLPPGVVLAGVGRRIGAYFLAFPLLVVTLGVGYVIWGLVVWGRGTSPALQVLGCRCWAVDSGAPAGFGRMALRDVVGSIVTGVLSFITGLVSFILFLTREDHRSLADLIGGTVVVHDPNKVLG